MTQATPKDYWISSNALYIELNALGNPDYIQASCVSGAQILVYVNGIISYDAGHNYRRWTLQAAPTVFHNHAAKYVYAAIPRDINSTKNALVVFPSEQIDIYGKNASETQVGSEEYYYIFLQGILTSSGDNGTTNRDWQQRISTGYLSSDEAIAANSTESEWYKYSSVDQITTFLKDLTMKAGTKFYNLYAKSLSIVSGGKITFEGQNSEITGIAKDNTPLSSEENIVTPKYLDDKALSKSHDDSTDYNLGMHDAAIGGKATIGGDTEIGGDAAVKGGARIDGKAAFGGDVTFGDYIGGMVGGAGGRITPKGAAELQSLTLREYLEVPELRYNRISIQVGNQWRAPGGGIIDTVTPDRDGDGNELASGTLTLHLEDGEVGAIAEGDICQGIWHEGMTADTGDAFAYDAMGRYDDSRGNFAFKGFYTAYFRIDAISDTQTNAKARYVLRPVSDTWAHQRHPHAMMHFVVYGNFTNADRQASRYSTLTYERYLRGVDNWEFTADMIAGQSGDLSNLTIHGLQMTGYSAYLNNIYMSGTISQFANLPLRLQIDDTLGGFIAWGEVDTVTCAATKGFDDVTARVTAWTITRDSGDSVDDVAWNNSAKARAFGGTIDLCFNPEENDIGNNAAVLSTIFTVTATIGEETATAEIAI